MDKQIIVETVLQVNTVFYLLSEKRNDKSFL